MTDDGNLLLRAILLHPDEDTPRLVYADWLEENGQNERAEFIRLQIELARVRNGPDPTCLRCYGGGGYRRPPDFQRPTPCANCHKVALERENTLLGRHGYAWLSVPLMALEAERHGRACVYRRGFIESVTCTADAFLKHADALLWRPDQTVECPQCRGRGEARYCDAAGDMDDEPCRACGGSLSGGYKRGTGRVPRPYPGTAQPIWKVVLTSWSGAPEVLEHRYLEDRWPGVVFELPS